MPNKWNVLERSWWEKLIDMIFNLISQSISHLDDIPISQFFIWCWAKVCNLWVVQGDSILYQAHIHWISLEAVNKNDKMQGCIGDNLLLFEDDWLLTVVELVDILGEEA